jgi:hypothetical protein
MLELKISNIDIYSLLDFQNENFDKNLITLQPIHENKHGLAMDGALYEVLLQISDVSTAISINLFSTWLIQQAEKNNIPQSFRLNERQLTEKDLKNQELLNRILEEELKTIQLKKKIEKAKKQV